MVRQSQKEPKYVQPMLLQRVQVLPKGPWHYEVKWDGYRMQAIKAGRRVRLFSRNGADYIQRFPGVVETVEKLRPAMLHTDGELVAMDRQGRPSFQVLQAGLPLPDGWHFGFYAFDCLNLDGRCLCVTQLSERREHLQEVVSGSGLRFSPTLNGTAQAVLMVVREQRLEGVVAKRTDSVYEPGKRSGAWVKLPLKQQGTFLVGGYRSGSGFATILVGYVDSGRFLFAGKLQVVLHTPERLSMIRNIKSDQTRRCPFANLPNVKQDPFVESVTPEEMSSFVWVRPEVPLPVAFQE